MEYEHIQLITQKQQFAYVFQNRPSDLQLYEKETPTQGHSCEYCEISKNNFLHKRPPLAASITQCL